MTRAALTTEQRAQLDALMPELRPLFAGDGVNRGWLHERTGIPLQLLTQWFRSLGMRRAPDRWRAPNAERLREGLNHRPSDYAS